MSRNYGYDDSYDEYSFPPAHNAYNEYDDDAYDCYFNDEDDYLDMSDACSSSDCTGLLVSGPGADEELDEYKEVYKFGQPKGDDDIM